VDDLRSEGVGMNACSDSLEEMESTGEGRPDEGASEEPLMLLLRLLGETVEGIWRPRRVGELRLELELLLLLSVDRGDTARSSASGKEGEIGVYKSSGAMHVGSCCIV
jgi:hypothetical protein